MGLIYLIVQSKFRANYLDRILYRLGINDANNSPLCICIGATI